MGTSYSGNRYRIDGVIDTAQPVMDNLTTLCNASGCWLTYDVHAGKWSVIINKADSSQWSFNDSNIIGPINISGSGLYNLYNSVKVSFPHEDLRNQKDYVQIDLPAEDRFPNEPDNVLEIDYKVVTNPVQAELLGFIELKQGRVDKVVTFTTDYSMINVRAGDLIDITNNVYGFDAKMFRILTVREVDGEDNNINIEITAMEYDETVYDETNLSRYQVSTQNGIVSIGAIPAPDTPSVTATELVSNPHVTATTTVNGGIVEQVEFWYTTDVPPTVNDENNRTYNLLGTVTPTTGATFAVGDDVTLDVPSLNAGEFLIKARCVNSQASSPFSDPSGILTYNAKQMTDAVSDNTVTVDSNGIVKELALASLLGLANDYFFNGNSAVGPGGGSSGNGTTFLLLEIQNFNTNATTGGSNVNSGSRFVPVVRIVPPGVPSIVEGIDQKNLSQCLVDYGGVSMPGGQIFPLSITSAGYTEATSIAPTHWPQYYPHKMLQILNITANETGQYSVKYAVDLGVYKYYYPTATKFELEIRGFWQLMDQVTSLSTTNTSSANIVATDSDWQTTTAGFGNIRASAAVWTNARNWTTGNIIPANWSTQGVGSSANTVVTSSVYPERLGSSNDLITTGDHITTFSYDFKKPAYKAPKFNPFNFSTPISTTVDIPLAWELGTKSNAISNVTPTSNVTVSCIPKTIGTTEVFYSTTGPNFGGQYNHYAKKATKLNGRYLAQYEIYGPIGNGGSEIVYPKVVPMPLTANVFSYNYVRSQSGHVANIGQYNPINGEYPVSEWYSLYSGSNQYTGSPGSSGMFYSSAANLSPTSTFYSNMSKVTATSTAFVAINPFNKSFGLGDEHFVPTSWGQLKTNANVSSTTVNDFNWHGVVINGQYFDRYGSDQFPYLDNAIPFPTGLFFNGANASVTTNHVTITANTNANVNADNSLGFWVSGTISS